MLRINACTTNAKQYYTQGLPRRAERPTTFQEVAYRWGGEGARRLGLSGVVLHEDLAALCDNLNPQTGRPLTVRTKAKRRTGYDLTFDAPKSVSLLYAFTQDQRLIDAYNLALDDTMIEVEARVETRVRRQGRDENRLTANLICAKLMHFTSRPQGGVPDPHLHTHVFVLNATHDEQENRWKAIELGRIKSAAPYYQAAFHTRLAENLQELGLGIRRTPHAFEIEGTPQQIISEFSRRRAHIVDYAKAKGITNPKTKARLAILTREAKRHDLSTTELRELWTLRLAQLPVKDRELFKKFLAAPELPGISAPDPHADDNAIDKAREHCFFHHSVIDEQLFLAAALRFSVGQTNVEQLRKTLSEDKRFFRRTVEGRQVITTPEVLFQEKHLVKWVRRGLETCPPFAYGHIPKNSILDAEQREAVRHILESRDRVTGVHGKSGAGKTTLMREAIDAIEAQGFPVIVLAPTTDASRRTLRKSGFPEAETVEKLMHSPALQQQAAGGALWIDEAGLLSVPAMKRLIDLADKLNARLIFSGDVRQHGPVERGDALRLLRERAGLEMAELTTIRRQKDPTYRAAIDDLSEGRIVEGYQKLDAMGAIREIANDSRHPYLANAYIESIRANRSALVVSPTHAEGRKVTKMIREGLKAGGELKGGPTIPALRKIELTSAEKKNHCVYRPGWIVQMTKAAPGIQAGMRLSIADANEQGLLLCVKDGSTHVLDPEEYASRFEVYEHVELNVGLGERIRITRNGKDTQGRRLDAGTIATVMGFMPFTGDLVLDTGAVVPRHYGHLTHGYVTTSYAAQSKTVQDIYLSESVESFAAAFWEQFYVSVSRGTEKLIAVTNNKSGLLAVIQKSCRRLSAMDIADHDNPEPAQPSDHKKELAQAQCRADRLTNLIPPVRLLTPAPDQDESIESIEKEDIPTRDRLGQPHQLELKISKPHRRHEMTPKL